MTALSATRPPELEVVLTAAGIDPALDGPDLQEVLQQSLAHRGSCCTWTPIHTGWVVTLHYPEVRTFFGTSLEDALSWCLLWVMAREDGTEVSRPRACALSPCP